MSSASPDRRTLLHQLERAIRMEQRARARSRSAGDRVVRLVRKLKASGLKSTLMALPACAAMGLPPTVEHRKRIASYLRLRLSRATKGRGFRSAERGRPEVAAVESDEMKKDGVQMGKGRLIKRVVTTE